MTPRYLSTGTTTASNLSFLRKIRLRYRLANGLEHSSRLLAAVSLIFVDLPIIILVICSSVLILLSLPIFVMFRLLVAQRLSLGLQDASGFRYAKQSSPSPAERPFSHARISAHGEEINKSSRCLLVVVERNILFLHLCLPQRKISGQAVERVGQVTIRLRHVLTPGKYRSPPDQHTYVRRGRGWRMKNGGRTSTSRILADRSHRPMEGIAFEAPERDSSKYLCDDRN